MEASTAAQPSSRKPDAAASLPPEAPESLKDAARGDKVDNAGERSAVSWLLGQQAALVYDVPVDFDTPEGMKKLTFVIRSLDGKLIDTIEKRFMDEKSGPFGEMDDLGCNAALVAESTKFIVDETGAQTEPTSEEFRKGLATAEEAIKARLHWQSGLLAGIAGQVRRISGWAPDRVGTATRRMTPGPQGSPSAIVDAAGNS